MKLINTLLTVLLITLLPSLGWSTPLDELVFRDGLYYPKFSDVPFTGEVTGRTQGNFPNQTKVVTAYAYEKLTEINSGKTKVIGKGLRCISDTLSVNYYFVEEGVYLGTDSNGKWIPIRHILIEDGEDQLKFGLEFVVSNDNSCIGGNQHITHIDRNTLTGRYIKKWVELDTTGKCLVTSIEIEELTCTVFNTPNSIEKIKNILEKNQI
jgi:hypothetical protein